MPPITVRFRWTLEDLLTGRKLSLRLNRSLFYIRIALGIALIGFGIRKYLLGDPLWVFFLSFAIILPIALLVKSVIQKQLIRRQFSKRPDANAEVAWTVTDQGISASSPHSKSEIQWSAFQRVIATPAGFLFMPNRQIFHFIPTRAFETPADIENLKTLARQHAKEFKEMK
ncbi:MAG TPA: YcxB family protein [Luteolibacter sp.]